MTAKVLARLAPDATDMIRADHARVLTTFHRYKCDAAAAAKRSLVATIWPPWCCRRWRSSPASRYSAA